MTAKAVPASRFFVFFLIAILGCCLDLATKHWIFAWRGMPHQQETFWLWQGVFGLTTSLNEGALFGFGQGQVSLFAILSVAAAVGILYWLFLAGAARDLLLTTSLGCVMAGILGNLYDRVGLHGLQWDGFSGRHALGDPVFAVRDWLDFRLINWPIFNVADSLLVTGAALLLWHAFCHEQLSAADSEAAPDA
ncbi:MAG: signal peptidase II [Pirellulales bacterium]